MRYLFLKITNIGIFICLVVILSLLLTGSYAFYLGPIKIEFINFGTPIILLFCLTILKFLVDPDIQLFFTRRGLGIDLINQKNNLKERIGETNRITYVRLSDKSSSHGLQHIFYARGSNRKPYILKSVNILGIIALFITLTILMTYPLIVNLGSYLPDSLGEPLLNTWILAWDARQIVHDPFNLFDANIFHPHKRVLAYSEHLLGNSLFALPIIRFTDNPILAYNVVFLLSFSISALAMYFLVKHLSGHTSSAIISALVFAFCPFRVSHLSCLQVLSNQWLPFIFLYLHKYMAEARCRHLIMLMIFYLLQTLSCGYYSIFSALFIPIFLLINIRGDAFVRQNLLRLIAAVFITATLLFPFIYPYIEVKKDWGFYRSKKEVIYFSARPRGYLRVPETNRAYNVLLSDPSNPKENILFPGFACLFLAILGIVGTIADHCGRKSNQTHSDKPYRPKGKWFQRCLKFSQEPVAFYILMGIFAFFFSFGPQIHFSQSGSFWGPYNLLYDLIPGFDSLRSPARLGLFVIIALSVLAGFGIRYVFEKIGGRKSVLIFLIFCSLMLIEYYSAPIPVAKINHGEEIPAVYQWLAKQNGDFAIIELPITDVWQEALYTYYSVYHWKKLVNGYSGYYPPLYYFYVKNKVDLFPNLDFLKDLQALQVKYLIWHSQLYPPEERERIKSQIANRSNTLRLIRQFHGDYVYQIDPGSFPTRPDTFATLDRSKWQVEANRFNSDSFKAVDGMLETYWSTQEPQRPGHYFLIDLIEPYRINGLRIRLGRNITDFPRGYKLEGSPDKKVWDTIKEETEPLPPLLSYARQPKDPIFEIYFQPQETRYLRMTLVGNHHQYPWTINEIEVLSPIRQKG